MFWTIASKMPVQANPIVCWKFLQMVHKIMRDGHANVVRHSVRYQAQIHDLGKLWGHLKEGYGKLISSYCKLIVQKFKFHDKFRGIPGNLMMTDEQYYKICGADVNNYFEFSIDMLDYMDDILTLQHAVFGSLDMSRANSMTTSGQCRLAPLILCILDSCQLYDYLVKSLFHLHSSLPPDTLFGHRDRFLVCYKKLKDFYLKCSNLQYFKHLVQVPHLPDDPPNFLIASDFTKHVKPAAVVREEEPEPEPEVEEPVENLIDMSMPEAAAEPPPPVPEVDERDFLIERLQREIRLLKEELGRVRAEDHRIITGLQEDISKLEKILSELRLSADKSFKENEELKKNIDPLKTDAESAEKQAKANQEKFQKMKDIYSKLRDEHVLLLRNHDTNSKQLSALKKSLEEKDQVLKESQLEVNRMVQEKQMVQDNLQKSADDVAQQLAEVSSFNSKLEKQKEDLESRLQGLEESQTQLETDLATKTSELNDMSSQLREARDAAAEREAELTEAKDSLQRELDQSVTDKANSEARLEAQLAEVREKLAETEVSKDCLEADLTAKISSLSQQCNQLESDKAEIHDQMNSWIKRLLDQTIEESIKMIQDAVEQGDNPAHSASTCTAEYLLLRANTVLEFLNKGQELGEISSDIQSSSNEDRDGFYSDLDRHLKATPQNGKRHLLGDFNT
ncbi:huntingtin-interacting protein 1 [Elysia marginata]|uniref:Huntingtin-interacting protein 1 n=1 Tax=Elysia marginata TaxID=1093978 RepID=A0AAV4H775_9GAST|nr:huntingtin-interacting protein 1 [Elysia marginata]